MVRDVRAAAEFYGRVVGLTQASEPTDEWAWFLTGDSERTQRIALARGPLLFEDRSPLPAGKRWGAVHFALSVPRETVERAVAHVRGEGVEVYGPTRFEWMRASSYDFYDLDGNLLEFWSPDPP